MKVDYSKIYYRKEIQVEGKVVGKNYPIDLDIQLKGFDLKPDCQVGHFGYNFYIRTPYGMNRKQYKNENRLESAVEKCLRNKGIEPIKWVVKESEAKNVCKL